MPADAADRLRIAWLGPPPNDAGGVPFMATVLIEALANRGHRIELFFAGDPELVADRVASHENVTVVSVDNTWEYDRWYSRSDALKHVTGGLFQVVNLARLGRALRRRHRQAPFDLVYQFSTLEVVAPLFAGRGLPPIVIHPEVHAAGELRWLWRERALARRCEPRWKTILAGLLLAARSAAQFVLSRKAEAFIVPSRRFAELLASDYRLDPQRCFVAPNPIDTERFVPAHGDDRPTGPLHVTMVSRVAVRKGIDLMVSVARELADLEGEVLITIIGDRSLWSDYRPLLDDLDPRVARWAGHLGPADVRDRLQRSRVVVQPSRYEPFALTVGEALACGTPVITTAEVGASEDVAAGAATRTAADARALADAIRRALLADESEVPRELARCEALRLFDPAVVADRVEGHIRTVLRRSGRPRRDAR